MKKFYVHLEDSEDLTKVLSDGDKAEMHYDNGNYSRLEVDGNSNFCFQWKHGLGEGRIPLPNGSVYDIVVLMEALNLGGDRRHSGKFEFYTKVDKDD